MLPQKTFINTLFGAGDTVCFKLRLCHIVCLWEVLNMFRHKLCFEHFFPSCLVFCFCQVLCASGWWAPFESHCLTLSAQYYQSFSKELWPHGVITEQWDSMIPRKILRRRLPTLHSIHTHTHSHALCSVFAGVELGTGYSELNSS